MLVAYAISSSSLFWTRPASFHFPFRSDSVTVAPPPNWWGVELGEGEGIWWRKEGKEK